MIRTRFAPSPTGFLHVGSLRTALFAYLLAKKEGGNLILRIEDTDKERYVDGAVENILHALQWAGISPDEGVTLKDDKITQNGKKGPYIQSERLEIYKEYVTKLVDSGNAYYAFDTPEELEKMREAQQTAKKQVLYDREGMNNQFTIPKEDLEKRVSDNNYVVRLKMPKEGETKFNDLVRGEVVFKNEMVDDQILLKSDGFPTYHLAVVVDDHLMEITHVVRGEEWISSTPKHIQLYKAFDWEPPVYAHLPLLVNEKKQKLSKRHGDVSVEDFKEAGYLPDALINFISFLGWNPGDEREIFSLKELIEEFDISKVGKAAAVFNREKLNWYNQQYIRQMKTGSLASLVAPYMVNAGLIPDAGMENSQFVKELDEVILLEKERATTLQDFARDLAFVYADSLEYPSELLIWKKGDREEAKKILSLIEEFLTTYDDKSWNSAALEESIMLWIKKNDYGVGNTLWPTRVALSGKKNSPGPFEILSVLGKDKSLKRIKEAIKLL